jgi:hypothetical protein
MYNTDEQRGHDKMISLGGGPAPLNSITLPTLQETLQQQNAQQQQAKKAKEAAYNKANPPLNIDNGASIRGCTAVVKNEDGNIENYNVFYNGAQLNRKVTDCNDKVDRYVASSEPDFWSGKTTHIFDPKSNKLTTFHKSRFKFIKGEAPSKTETFAELKEVVGTDGSRKWDIQPKTQP